VATFRSYLIPFTLLASFLLSAALHAPIFNREIQGVHNWRQSQTMWNVRNFVRYEDDIRNPRVSHFNGSNDNLYRYEFPIYQYAIAQLQKVFGEELWVARGLTFLIGLFGLLAFYGWLRVLAFPPWAAVGATVALQFSPLFYFYTINVLPDNLALAASLGYLWLLFAWFRDGHWGQLVGAVACLGLATLAKLPYAMFGIVAAVWFFRNLGGWALTRETGRDPSLRVVRRKWVIFTISHLIALVPAYRWYAWVMPGWRNNPVLYGIFGGAADWGKNIDILFFHLGETIPYYFFSPAVWLPAAVGLLFIWRRAFLAYWLGLVGITLLYVALQWDVIGVVHDYYLLPFLPGLYLLVAVGIDRLLEFGHRYRPARVIVPLCLLAAPLAAYQLRQDYWRAERGYFYSQLQDAFRHRDALRQLNGPDDKVIVLNDPSYHIFTWLIRRRGYVFSRDGMQGSWIDDMRRRGATHLFSTSRKVETDPEVASRLGELVFAEGDLRVYRLD
jgi:hypothetical protein